ncbi:hypothetical protein ACJMK2_008805 [Sinanodonta woodiana]|uniref:Uncharacterized protein n=1 Tax=Sinanodonta woodiana TaxID=1069815 RepID=A0ABD3VMP1_SINWO
MTSTPTTLDPSTTTLPPNDTNNTSTPRSPTTFPPNDTNNTSTPRSPTTSLPSDTNTTSTSRSPTESTVSATSNISIKVIVPAVVVPCGLLIIGAIVLVIFCVRRKARKNVRERPDGTSIQDKGNNIDGWKQSLGHGKVTDNLDTVYTTPDGFIIYPGPAAVSTARSYKDNKYHGVTDQYSRPSPGTHLHQADYIPSTYTPARAYTHRGEKHHIVTDQYGRPYPSNYGNQTANFAGTYKSARNYAQKGKTYEGPQPVYNLMSNSRLAYGQTAYYPQTGYYGQSGQDVYYSGGQQYSYGQRSRSHHGHSGRKPQRDYYSQYEMADYGSNGAGHRHTKQDPAFYY